MHSADSSTQRNPGRGSSGRHPLRRFGLALALAAWAGRAPALEAAELFDRLASDPRPPMMSRMEIERLPAGPAEQVGGLIGGLALHSPDETLAFFVFDTRKHAHRGFDRYRLIAAKGLSLVVRNAPSSEAGPLVRRLQLALWYDPGRHMYVSECIVEHHDVPVVLRASKYFAGEAPARTRDGRYRAGPETLGRYECTELGGRGAEHVGALAK